LRVEGGPGGGHGRSSATTNGGTTCLRRYILQVIFSVCLYPEAVAAAVRRLSTESVKIPKNPPWGAAVSAATQVFDFVRIELASADQH
jgi:hypothetical protein